MNRKNLLRRVGGFVLAALLLSGIAITSGTTAEAQRRSHGRIQGRSGGRVVVVRPVRPLHRPFRSFRNFGLYGNPYGYPYGYYDTRYSQYVFSNSEAAVSQGYKDGLKTGSNDARRRQSYKPERSHYFHDAGFGNYAEAYREGFSNGYGDGFES